MTQYDAGPGDWSDREWESPDRKKKPHTAGGRLVLPPWALLALVVAAAILLCIALVYLVQALRGGDAGGTVVPTATETAELRPTFTPTLVPTLEILVPEPTEAPVVEATPAPEQTQAIEVGAEVVVKGAGKAGVSLRAEPNTKSKRLGVIAEGTVLKVLDGPQEGEGFVWWKVRTPGNAEGWSAGDWLVLKTD